MAYKPFKVNKGYYDLDEPKNKDPKYEIARMKLFGFRSGIAWKMIPALAYYIIVGVILFSSIIGEIHNFTFEDMDVLLTVLKYVFLIILLYSPAIFLSEFEYNKKIPIFNKQSTVIRAIAICCVILFSYFMIVVYQYCMSDTYKNSADEFYEQLDNEYQQQLDEYEKEMEEQESTEITTSEQ